MKNGARIKLLLSLAWRVSPAYLVVLVLSAVVASVQVLINVVLPKFLVDELMGGRVASRLVLFVGAIVVSNVAFSLLANAVKRYLDEKNVYMSEMFQLKMAEKIMNTAYMYLEMPHYLDLKERATFAIRNQSALLNFVEESAKVLKSLMTIAGLVAVMVTFSVPLVIVLSVIVAVSIAIYASMMRKQFVYTKEIIPINRRYGYYVGCCFNDKLQKDIRLFGMQGMMIDRVQMYNKTIHDHFMRMYKIIGRHMGAMGVLSDLQAALAYGYAGVRVLTDALGPRMGIGDFTMYVGAAVNFTRVTSQLGSSIVSLLRILGYLEPFAEFMTLPDESETGGHEPLDGGVTSIRFENVSFRYPESDVDVLKNVSFSIDNGEKISVVGLNGAGKTTLVKLLCRLYRPTEGTIYVNGRDIFDYDLAAYMRHVSAVFQDYKLLAFSVEENVTGGEPDAGRAKDVLAKVGLNNKLDTLENGARTLLGKAYNEDGTEFSGGEQQKVAIARALYKGASLVILDEPTSALDPLAEAEIYENFNSLVGGQTAIYISHRMSSSVFCDRILLLNGGTVEDFDTHAALMGKTDSLYYKLFMLQADHYRIEEGA